MKASTIEGWMTPAELDWIAANAAQSRIVIEIGVWKGRSTAAWCEHCPGTVFAVEDWRPERTRCGSYRECYANGRESIMAQASANLFEFIESGRLHVVEHESGEAAKLLSQLLVWRKADLVFIDGNHAVPAVKDDIRNYLPLIRPGGLISGHDYLEVHAAVDELLPGVSRGPDSIWYTRCTT